MINLKKLTKPGEFLRGRNDNRSNKNEQRFPNFTIGCVVKISYVYTFTQ